MQKTQRFASGEIDARINVQQGRIQGIKFYGDYFGEGDPAVLEQQLTGRRFNRADLEEALREVNVGFYFGGVSREELLELLY